MHTRGHELGSGSRNVKPNGYEEEVEPEEAHSEWHNGKGQLPLQGLKWVPQGKGGVPGA